jgi:hypothetical protein
MNTIQIDVDRFIAREQVLPIDDQYGYWTFIIGGQPMSVFGTFSEATTVAKLYVRMYESDENIIVLDSVKLAGQVHMAS